MYHVGASRIQQVLKDLLMQYEQARLDRVEELGLGLVKSGYSFLDIMGTIFF